MKATIKSRFSLGMKIVGILSCLAIVSVGFAAWWIINYPGQKEFESGSFAVYAVDEKEITFTDIAAVGESTITFGSPATGGTKGWLGYTDVNTENLTAIVKFTVAIKDADENEKLSDYLDGVNVAFDAGAYDAVDQKYVAASKVYYQIGATADDGWTELTNGLVPATDDNTADVYLKFEFDWGTATDNENPYVYFNPKGMTDLHDEETTKTNKTVATEMLTAINGLNTNKYKVTITAAPKSNSN